MFMQIELYTQTLKWAHTSMYLQRQIYTCEIFKGFVKLNI